MDYLEIDRSNVNLHWEIGLVDSTTKGTKTVDKFVSMEDAIEALTKLSEKEETAFIDQWVTIGDNRPYQTGNYLTAIKLNILVDNKGIILVEFTYDGDVDADVFKSRTSLVNHYLENNYIDEQEARELKHFLSNQSSPSITFKEITLTVFQEYKPN